MARRKTEYAVTAINIKSNSENLNAVASFMNLTGEREWNLVSVQVDNGVAFFFWERDK